MLPSWFMSPMAHGDLKKTKLNFVDFLKLNWYYEIMKIVQIILDISINVFKFQAVAMDTAAFGITCNALCPAWTDTPRKWFFLNHGFMLLFFFLSSVLSVFLEKIRIKFFLKNLKNCHSDSKEALHLTWQ